MVYACICVPLHPLPCLADCLTSLLLGLLLPNCTLLSIGLVFFIWCLSLELDPLGHWVEEGTLPEAVDRIRATLLRLVRPDLLPPPSHDTHKVRLKEVVETCKTAIYSGLSTSQC